MFSYIDIEICSLDSALATRKVHDKMYIKTKTFVHETQNFQLFNKIPIDSLTYLFQ